MEMLQTFLTEQFFGEGLLSLREVLRLLLLSGLFTLVCLLAFPRNAPSRRVLLLACVLALIVLPWILASVDAVWHVVMDQLPAWRLSATLPNIVLVGWLAVALLLIVRHLLAVRHELRGVLALPDETDMRLNTQLERLALQAGSRVPRLKLGDCACSTTLTGPVLVLPEYWREWDEQTLTAVMTHELVHIARGDDRWLLVTRLLVLSY